jgi:NAD(P)H-hydrate epimerase
MEILTSAEMGAADRRTAEQFGVPLVELMENAGTAVARFCLRRYPAARRVVVLCGKGNNGGDGFVAARVLAVAGVGVAVLLLGREDEVKGEAAAALARLRAEAPAIAIRPLDNEAGLAAMSDTIASAELLVDAVVGTGFKPPLRGLPAALRELAAKSDAPVVAVDLPSGWDADSIGQIAQGAFRADAVVTFTRPKLSHVFGHLTSATFGPVVVAEIGSPAEAIQSASGLSWAGTSRQSPNSRAR